MPYVTIQIDRHSDDARSAFRHEKAAAGTVRADSLAPIDVRLVDISTDGIGFETEVSLPVGAQIMIGVSSIRSQRATIVRREGMFHACAFDRPISSQEVARAGLSNTVAFPSTVLPSEIPDPHVDKWPTRVNLAILFGGASTAWALVASIVHMVRG